MAKLTSEEVMNLDPEMRMLQQNKEGGYNFRFRRHQDWNENYELSRDKVIINRLTQRQSVNLPIMKTHIRSLLKDVDDMPVLYFENLDNDKEAELFKNEYWKYTVEQNNMELQDIVDKRQVFLFGRTFGQWQIADGKVKWTVQEPFDMLVSRYTDPFNIHSSRFLIHNNIFVPLSSLELNEDYNKKEIQELKEYFATTMGLIKSQDNQKMLVEKNKRLGDMGVLDLESPILGETYVELTMHFVWRDDEKNEKGEAMESQIFLYVEAEGLRRLMKKPLEQVIGVTSDHYWMSHYPYDTWADDVERLDFWSDGIADILRTPNKVLNTWFSQLVENRTMRSFGMHYYNSGLEGFNPQTWQPQAWGWYGLPVPANMKIDDVLQKVEVPDLAESLNDMQFVIDVAQNASGAVATEQGAQTQKQVTLGEVQLVLSQAKERSKSMSKFYTPAWKERGMIFVKLIEAAGDKLDAVTLYKKGRNTDNIYAREVSIKDWQTASGYRCKVWSQDEKDSQDTDSLEKLNAVKMNMPGNAKLDEIYDRKLLEFANLKPDEVNEIMQAQKQQRELGMMGIQMPGQAQGQPPQKQPRPALQQPQQKQLAPGVVH